MDNKQNIKDFSLEQLEAYIVDKGFPKFRAKQVFEWIYKDAESFQEMKNLPKELMQTLSSEFYMGRAVVLRKQVSQNDNTRKYLLEFRDGAAVECVLMEYSYGRTICISTQVGCRMACSFCASAYGGLQRNLTSGEMMEEVMAVSRDIGSRISNIVLMGTGEPFDNYDEVLKFLRMVNHEKTLNIGFRHITLSTSGIVPQIVEFAKENIPCTLAISLHGADDATRSQLMPVNRKYKIEELLQACDEYIEKTNRRVTFEYALIKGVNDGNEDAQRLASLLKGKLCHVNLIPVNKVEGKSYEKTESVKIKRFLAILEKSGVEATTRRELGSDIDAACGQLRRKQLEDTLQ